MKILIKSVILFFFGVYVEMCKRKFDRQMDKCITKGRDISSPRLSKSSDRCYGLYQKFRHCENELAIDIKTAAARRLCSRH